MEKSNNVLECSVEIAPIEKRRISVKWSYYTVLKEEPDGRISGYIPGFDIYLYGNNRESLREKSRNITYIFIDNFLGKMKSKGLSELVKQLKRRGFFEEKNNNLAMKELLENKLTNASFKSFQNTSPIGYNEKEELVGELEAVY